MNEKRIMTEEILDGYATFAGRRDGEEACQSLPEETHARYQVVLLSGGQRSIYCTNIIPSAPQYAQTSELRSLAEARPTSAADDTYSAKFAFKIMPTTLKSPWSA